MTFAEYISKAANVLKEHPEWADLEVRHYMEYAEYLAEVDENFCVSPAWGEEGVAIFDDPEDGSQPKFISVN